MDYFSRNKNKQPAKRQTKLMQGQDEYSFRRSRTLTGSISSDVRSVAEYNSNLKSPRLKLHKLRRHQKIVASSLVIVLLFVTGLGWMVGQFIRVPSDFQYSQEMNLIPPSQQYAQVVNEYFAKYPTERFLFRLESERLNAFMIERHPEVKDVRLSSPMPGVFSAELYFRKPLLTWQSFEKQLYIDEEGVSFERNYFLEPSVVVDDQSGITLDNSNVVASGRFIQFLGRVVSSVASEGMSVQKIIIPADTARQVDVQLVGRDYPIKTHIDREPSSQAKDLVSAIRHLDKNGVVPDYVDVRIAGKAYYR